MKMRHVSLGLAIGLALSLLVLGVVLLRSEEGVVLAQDPILSIAAAWPPIPQSLSASADKFSKLGGSDANANGIVVVWSEGTLSPNGEIRAAWNTGSGWTDATVYSGYGYKAFASDVALLGSTAHFVWVMQSTSDLNAYWVLYRSVDILTGVWTSWDTVFPRAGDPTGRKLGEAQVAVTAAGVHVVWTRSDEVSSQPRDRIYYRFKAAGGGWSDEERISGALNDQSIYAEDMPAITAKGDQVYVAWREKSLGQAQGIWIRRRLYPSLDWEPDGSSATTPYGYQLSTHNYDEFPALASAGSRVYAVWDRWVGQACGSGMSAGYCTQVYSLTHRVLTNDNIETGWWPVGYSQDLLDGSGSPITATSQVSTAEGNLDPTFQVPVPNEYTSGVRPAIEVLYSSGVYTPFVSWHYWKNPSDVYGWGDTVDSTWPYRVVIMNTYTGDLGSARWDYTEGWDAVEYRGATGVFASPAFEVLAPGTQRPYDVHILLNVRLGDDASPWDVVYTNPYEFHWVYLPVTLKAYP